MFVIRGVVFIAAPLFFVKTLARFKKLFKFVKNQITNIMKKLLTFNYEPSSDSGYSYSYYADKYASSSYATYGVSYDFLTAEQKAKLR